jgi:inositol transport system substrate-binding protein
LVAGCGDGSGSSASDDRLTIGAVFYDESAPNTAPLREAMQDVADEVGADLITTHSRSDVSKERADIEDLVTRGVDAIVMQPIDGETKPRAAQLVNDADIPLFTLNTGFPDDADVDVVSYIGQS